MRDLELYDEGKAVDFANSKNISLPLLSWDFHLENLYSLSRLYKDMHDIKKLTSKLIVDVDLSTELKENNKVIVITDKELNIEFASANMFGMSGYLPSEILGKTPKIFQGPETDVVVSKKIRQYVNNQEPFDEILLNYKKNKALYKCHIKGYPIFDKKGNLQKYVAVESAA